jgi:transposase-like protein
VGAAHGAGHRQRPGLTTDEQARVKALERENRELRRAADRSVDVLRSLGPRGRSRTVACANTAGP